MPWIGQCLLQQASPHRRQQPHGHRPPHRAHRAASTSSRPACRRIPARILQLQRALAGAAYDRTAAVVRRPRRLDQAVPRHRRDVRQDGHRPGPRRRRRRADHGAHRRHAPSPARPAAQGKQGVQGRRRPRPRSWSTRRSTPSRTSSTTPGSGTPYEQWTKAELVERAKELDIEGRYAHEQGRADRRPARRLTIARPRRRSHAALRRVGPDRRDVSPPRAPLRCLLRDAPVAQLAEATASKSVRCGFESHPGHDSLRAVADTRVLTSNPALQHSGGRQHSGGLPVGSESGRGLASSLRRCSRSRSRARGRSGPAWAGPGSTTRAGSSSRRPARSPGATSPRCSSTPTPTSCATPATPS